MAPPQTYYYIIQTLTLCLSPFSEAEQIHMFTVLNGIITVIFKTNKGGEKRTAIINTPQVTQANLRVKDRAPKSILPKKQVGWRKTSEIQEHPIGSNKNNKDPGLVMSPHVLLQPIYCRVGCKNPD